VKMESFSQMIMITGVEESVYNISLDVSGYIEMCTGGIHRVLRDTSRLPLQS